MTTKKTNPASDHKMISLRMTTELHRRIKAAADADQRPVTIFILRAVEKFLAESGK